MIGQIGSSFVALKFFVSFVKFPAEVRTHGSPSRLWRVLHEK